MECGGFGGTRQRHGGSGGYDDLLQAAGFIGHPDAPDLALGEAVEHYGDPIAFTLYMVLLCGGLVATVGDADPDWLKQFDLVS
ncbi:hypothetical protein [Streptomyces lichenis]|uniref:Uncharacterized protein n=1 Tax=Streptomyces lichenis TaxID=2306967 RepID=A0ABT0I589_9ACTN|nr:hypothetical protein [Streptomyces lichenis]MCK8676480.1 hypothetical protein [Streptomyces lichenis]